MIYKARVELEKVQTIDYIELVYQAMWRVNTKTGMAANGFTRLKSGEVVFTSNNDTDIRQVLRNKCWDTKLKFKVYAGDTVYIVPVRSVFKTGKCDTGVKAIALSDMENLNTTHTGFQPAQWLQDEDESITMIG